MVNNIARLAGISRAFASAHCRQVTAGSDRRRKPSGRRLGPRLLLGIATLWVTGLVLAAPLPATPLEQAHYQRISRAAEISADLDALAAASPLARKEVVGESVERRPIETLVLSTHQAGGRPRVLLVATQHGAAEPAGGEAMLSLARQLLQGDLRPLLEDIDVVLLPDANPDGRDGGHRSNARHVNLNTDFVLLSQPESQALVAALERYQPLAVLDVHESAVLKRQTLAREGYLTDFDAQFETANNPAIPAALRDYGQQHLLPALLAAVRAAGLPAQRYIGEITSAGQPITNGGLSLRNFRNLAGISGALAVLVETKLDSRDEHWPSYRNIEVRVARSLICQRAFLRLVHAERETLRGQSLRARAAVQSEPLALYAAYVEDLEHPRVDIVLRRLDNHEIETLHFADHRRVASADVIAMPVAYVVTHASDALRAALERHGIEYASQSQGVELTVVAERYGPLPAADGRVALLASTTRFITTAADTLIINVAQSHGRLVPLLLDPRSTSSLFRLPEFASELVPEREFGVYRVHTGVTRAAPTGE